jgi:hypothetical protein
VLQNDKQAQIVHFPQTNTTAYAFITPTENQRHGHVIATASPILAMTTLIGTTLNLSLADPDPAIDAPQRKVIHRIKLKGTWENAQVRTQHGNILTQQISGDQTLIEISLQDGHSCDITLQRQR